MHQEPQYDVIVVGAGSAGAVVAAGLSADPSRSVLLLEAGGEATGATRRKLQSPNFWHGLLASNRLWPELRAVRNATQTDAPYLRGRGLGGSSSINGLCALRGTPDDYDSWERDFGCDGWGWPEMLQAFREIETDDDYGSDELHGSRGPLPIVRTPLAELPSFDLAMRAALGDLGYASTDDYHAAGATGVSRVALTMRDGRRVSTADAFLEPTRDRANLSIRPNVLVDRVVFDGRRTVGIRTVDGEFLAAPEVVLSAGAIHSPAILLRSGLGTGRNSLPVGQNLTDHALTAPIELQLSVPAPSRSSRRPISISMLRFSSDLDEAGQNDMQIAWHSPIGVTRDGQQKAWLAGEVMHSYSRGSIRLRSKDPIVEPIIDLQLLSDDRDRRRLVDCVHRLVAIATNPKLADVACRAEVSDGAGMVPVTSLRTDRDVDDWLEHTVGDSSHAVGTCRMGRSDDPSAVVDTECRVIGFSGLRVCDASVMPDVPRANTHLTTVAIAHRFVALFNAQRSRGEVALAG